jgi:hypothetical protein
MPELLKACAGCGRAMNPNAVLYDAEARAICDACFHQADLLATDRRAADNIRKAGYLSLAGGVASLIAPIAMGFVVVCVVLTLTSGVYAVQSLARGNERFTRYLTPLQRQLVWAGTIGGISLMTLSLMGVNLATVLLKS